MTGPTTIHLQGCLDRLRAGDPAAREELLRHSQERLRELTRRMLCKFGGVRRWEETDDVLQRLLMRLDPMLQQIEVGAVCDYLRLAATNLRQVLLDLARQYGGPEGLGANHATPDPALRNDDHRGTQRMPVTEPRDRSCSPNLWTRFHLQVDCMSEHDRELFDLLWYHDLTQDEAAQVLNMPINTLRRHWQAARIRLMEALGV